MGEIAEDNSVSKANLYYYFPDKTSLVMAVVKHIIHDAQKSFVERTSQLEDVLQCFYSLIDIAKEYFEKYYLLHVTMGTADNSLNVEHLQSIAAYIQQIEMENVITILKKGTQKGELVTMDIERISNIYINIIKGIAMLHISCELNKDLPQQETFTTISDQQKLATQIFVNGLRKQKENQ